MTGTGTITKRGNLISGVLTFPAPLGDVLVLEFTGEGLGDGIYRLDVEATDQLLRLAEAVLGGSVRRVEG